MAPEANDHFTLWNLGPQQLLVDFHGGRIVADAGLLAVRALERPLRVIADLAQRFPDPRAPQFIHHSVEAMSGKGGTSPHLPPLRTVLATFTAHGSSNREQLQAVLVSRVHRQSGHNDL
jgi:hypothetical protein